MKIYLDYNLFAYLHGETKPELRAKIVALSDRHNFPYCPAYMEEIATALMQPSSIEPIDRLVVAYRKIDSISRISCDAELFPADFGPTVLKREPPLECFRRVLLHYKLNPIFEKNESKLLASFKEGDPNGILANEMSNLREDFLLDPGHRHSLELKLHFNSDLPFVCKTHGVKSFTWPEIAGHHPVVERAIELAMNFLEQLQVRYHPEPVRKSRCWRQLQFDHFQQFVPMMN